ncbi:HEAT repeat domain-containing protein [Paracrocinitomix mangrovi]|uniref:HEAT repeat domain-containing protein n=1 Tax=Paracrocinitomix mangrovi TaxID=2862509 RepID=UPI001C8E1AF2|nr:HEAT repeat domain-containing protein [Paracrocinitomix mangrovi]UKN03556.1 HEAT repeat domain-containing protein [Paracrocinitomix mangrovi]
MAEKDSQKNKKVKELLSLLASKDEQKQLQAIKSLKVHGDETVIEPLVQVLAASSFDSVKYEITELLNTIKSSKVPAQVAKCLENPDYKDVRQILLASIWNSGLDYRPYLGIIATATVEGDFMDAMECITIIENIEEQLEEEHILDAIMVFNAYLVDNNDNDDSKVNLIKEIVVILQQMNDNL